MAIGQGLDLMKHECRSSVSVNIKCHRGTYFGEVLKGTNTPDGRGILRTDSNQTYIRHFKNGDFDVGNTVFIDL